MIFARTPRAQIGRWVWIAKSTMWAFREARQGRWILSREITNEHAIGMTRKGPT